MAFYPTWWNANHELLSMAVQKFARLSSLLNVIRGYRG